jgi:hypothetical protein
MKHSFLEIHEVNLRTLMKRHVITFRKQLINLLYQPAWAILVKLGEINMIPLIIIINTERKFRLYLSAVTDIDIITP